MKIDEFVEQNPGLSTVLIVGQVCEDTYSLIDEFSGRGVNILGPVNTASLALALVAQTPTDLALVARKLGGRRHGPELARCLEETWGVPSVVLDGP
jgi:hypothetical protein